MNNNVISKIKNYNLNNDDILSGIANTAMQIEKNDRKADKIILPAEIYYNLATAYPSVVDTNSTFNGRGRSVTYPVIHRTSSLPGRVVNTTYGLQVLDTAPRLWGMEVEVSGKAKDITIKSQEMGIWYFNEASCSREQLIDAAKRSIVERNQMSMFARENDVPQSHIIRRTLAESNLNADIDNEKIGFRQIETISLCQIKMNILRKNLTPIVKHRASPNYSVSSAELIALEMLREMITEAEYRKYLTQGFILVKSASGKVYQVFREPGSKISVWSNGKLIEKLCIQIKQEIKAPPTDRVIAFKTIIEVSESQLRNLSNVFKMTSKNDELLNISI
jgi:hypothetical protein